MDVVGNVLIGGFKVGFQIFDEIVFIFVEEVVIKSSNVILYSFIFIWL